MRTSKATFDPAQSQFIPIESGTYPAHITGITEREVNTKVGQATVFNLTYKVADEAGKIQQSVWEMDGFEYKTDKSGAKIPVVNGDGTQKTVECTHIVGKEFGDKGYFVFSDSALSGRNRKYFNLLNLLNVKLEEEEDEGVKVQRLVLLDEEDVVGKPVYVRLSPEKYVTRNTKHLPEAEQDWRTAWKVDRIDKWPDGQTLSADEVEGDIPF